MNSNPNNSRPEDAKRLGFTWEFMDRIRFVCYTPGSMNVMRTMLGVTNWDKRLYQMGRAWLASQTHLKDTTVSTLIQEFVRDGLLTELISENEVHFEKHRQNYRFNLPPQPILDCRNWYPHAKNKHHDLERAVKFSFKLEAGKLEAFPDETNDWSSDTTGWSPF
jgi:hypothetical protein